MAKKKGMSMGAEMAIGAGVAALGAGAYYLLGPNSKKHQKKAAVWMNKMEKEVKQKIAKAKKMSVPIYHQVVDAAAESYSKQYKAQEKEIKAFAKRLKGEWKVAEKKAVKKAIRTVKKATSK